MTRLSIREMDREESLRREPNHNQSPKSEVSQAEAAEYSPEHRYNTLLQHKTSRISVDRFLAAEWFSLNLQRWLHTFCANSSPRLYWTLVSAHFRPFHLLSRSPSPE